MSNAPFNKAQLAHLTISTHKRDGIAPRIQQIEKNPWNRRTIPSNQTPHDSTTTKPQALNSWNSHKPSHLNEQLNETSGTKTNYSNNYSLRSKRKKASEQITNTENDVTHDKTVLNHTINKAHLRNLLSPSQQHLQNLHLSTPNKMSESTKTSNSQVSPPKPKFFYEQFSEPI